MAACLAGAFFFSETKEDTYGTKRLLLENYLFLVQSKVFIAIPHIHFVSLFLPSLQIFSTSSTLFKSQKYVFHFVCKCIRSTFAKRRKFTLVKCHNLKVYK